MKRSRIIRSFFALGFAYALVLSGGCSKKEIKPVPEGAIYYNQANNVIKAIRKGYVQKDLGAIKAVSTEKGYGEIAPDFGKFDSAELSFEIRWIDIESGTIDVNVAWEGVWKKGGKTDSERGMAVFELTGTPPKFNAVLKGSPFIYPK